MSFGCGEAESYEADAKPQPLRIIKREHRTTSDFSCPANATNTYRSPFNSLASEAGGRCSISNDGRLARLTSVVSPHPPLHVPKQRRTNARRKPRRASSVLGGVTSSHPDLPSPTRAVTTGTVSNAYVQKPFLNGSSMPATASQSVDGARSRAVTAGDTGIGISNGHLLHLQPLRSSWTQPSLRQRLLSRVMSGVSGKPHISHAAMEREAVVQELHSPASCTTGPIEGAQSERPRSSTRSSIETISTLGPNLELALAAFPTPPVSAVTSPTTVSSFETSRTALRVPRKLVQPTNTTMVGAELTLLPETEQLSLDGGQTVFVAVDVAGEVNPIDGRSEAPLPSKGLDVAVVIDSTLFTSPATLLAHCEAARFIASLLDAATDRLAVLTTRPQRTDPPDFNIVAPLNRTTIRMIKSIVDTIVSSIEKPASAALGVALDCAIDILTDSTSQLTDNGSTGTVYGHIFVLTANPYGLDPILLTHEKCVIHLVCPGSVLWRGTDQVTCNGWKFGSFYSNSLQSISWQKDKDRSSLFNRLRVVIALARKGKASGKLMDLVVDIEAGPNCSIEGVMGQKTIAEIRPGETATALVKVRVGAAAAKGFTLSPSTSSKTSPSPASAKDLLDELDEMLGTSLTPILVAKLTYRHSLLPTGTRCSTVAAAKLKRSMANDPLEEGSAKCAAPRVSKNLIAVQKRLAYYLATHHSPRHAILTIREHFGDHGCQSSCPEYIKLLIEELKFQSRIVERFDLSSPIQCSPSAGRNTATSHTYEHFGHGLFAASNYKPQDWLIGVPDEEIALTPPDKAINVEKPQKSPAHYGHRKAEVLRSESRRAVPRPSARQAGVAVSTGKRNSGISHTTSKESVDEARKIWSDIRKLSKGDRGSMDVGKTSGVSHGHSDSDRARALKNLAVKNKRSVGADTLMSLQEKGSGKAKENVPPWL